MMYVNPFWFGAGVGAITTIVVELIITAIIMKKGD